MLYCNGNVNLAAVLRRVRGPLILRTGPPRRTRRGGSEPRYDAVRPDETQELVVRISSKDKPSNHLASVDATRWSNSPRAGNIEASGSLGRIDQELAGAAGRPAKLFCSQERQKTVVGIAQVRRLDTPVRDGCKRHSDRPLHSTAMTACRHIGSLAAHGAIVTVSNSRDGELYASSASPLIDRDLPLQPIPRN